MKDSDRYVDLLGSGKQAGAYNENDVDLNKGGPVLYIIVVSEATL